MSQNIWSKIHSNYREQDWINKPSLFAEIAIKYFPKSGKVLDLGAGQGQDTRFFAEQGYQVVSTDISDSAIELNKAKIPPTLKDKIVAEKLDLTSDFSFSDESFDVVYAHLSLHYFDKDTTIKIFDEIERVLKPGGIFAFLTNSTSDPEYKGGEEIEQDFFKIDEISKRYFSVETARKFVSSFNISLLDNFGETYKDSAKDIHNLIRFVGAKPFEKETYKMTIPFVGGIIERVNDGEVEILMQTRWKPNRDPLYSGTLEFPAGILDKPYESVYEALNREIKEECGLTLKKIRGDSQTKKYSPKGNDESFGFRPYCCVQQLKDGKPWVGFIFVCEVESGEPKAQVSEAKNPQWMKLSEVKRIFENEPEKLFALEISAWEFYFKEFAAGVKIQ